MKSDNVRIAELLLGYMLLGTVLTGNTAHAVTVTQPAAIITSCDQTVSDEEES